jgi:protein disulfide-isomerase-like protein
MFIAATLGVFLYCSTAGASSVITLDSDSFGKHVGGAKGVFVKFFAPWCGHCKAMAKDWETLATAYADSEAHAIAEVDCTINAELCATHGVKGYPTLQAFGAGSVDGEVYENERTLEAFKTFVDNGGLSAPCSSSNRDRCNAVELKALEALEILGADEIATRIKASEQKAKEATDAYTEKIEEISSVYHLISKANDEVQSILKKELKLLLDMKVVLEEREQTTSNNNHTEL